MRRISEGVAALRQVVHVPQNPIFHATHSLVNILQDQELKSSSDSGESRFGGVQEGISFSRNLDFLEKWEFGNAILCFDRSKISTRYPIAPVQYQGGSRWEDEFEERVMTNRLPLTPYLSLIIMKDNSRVYRKEWATWSDIFFAGKVPIVVKTSGKNYEVL